MRLSSLIRARISESEPIITGPSTIPRHLPQTACARTHVGPRACCGAAPQLLLPSRLLPSAFQAAAFRADRAEAEGAPETRSARPLYSAAPSPGVCPRSLRPVLPAGPGPRRPQPRHFHRPSPFLRFIAPRLRREVAPAATSAPSASTLAELPQSPRAHLTRQPSPSPDLDHNRSKHQGFRKL